MTCRGKNGVTLVELLVAMFLMLIVLATVNIVFAFVIKSYYLYLDKIEVQENLRVGINRISREVRQAAEFSSYQNSGAGRLIFLDIEGNVISYRISASGDSEAAYQLIRSINGHGHNPVARYVEKLDVVPNQVGSETRKVTITLVGKKGDSGKMEVSTTVTLRNN